MENTPLCNYHTHTWRCHHATGDVADYCEAARAAGMRVLGMSDHTPLPDGRWSGVRMPLEQLDDYLEDIERARAEFPELVILKALECEYIPEFESFYREELLGRRGLDYLVGGAHAFPLGGEWRNMYGQMTSPEALRAYADYLIEGMESGLFAFIAHPDLFGHDYLTWDADAEACSRDILAAAADLAVPLEINGYGMRKRLVEAPDGPRLAYPWEPFWRLAAEYDIRVLGNSDAHRPEDVAANIADGIALAERLGLALADMSHLRPVQAVRHER